jgi:hypothetical protein
MSVEDQVKNLLAEVTATHAELKQGHGKFAEKAELARLSSAIDALSRKLNRPGGGGGSGDTVTNSLRESARGLLEIKNQSRTPKTAPDALPFMPSETELEEAEHAVRGLSLLRHSPGCRRRDEAFRRSVGAHHDRGCRLSRRVGDRPSRQPAPRFFLSPVTRRVTPPLFSNVRLSTKCLVQLGRVELPTS